MYIFMLFLRGEFNKGYNRLLWAFLWINERNFLLELSEKKISRE